MAMTFHYKETHRPDGSPTKCPMIPVTYHGGQSFTSMALLDSGADTSVIHLALAEVLGITLESMEHGAFGIGGSVPSKRSRMSIEVKKGHERYRINIPVIVVLGDYEFPPIIGRAGFFNKFKITFDEANEKVTLKRTSRQ